MGDDMEKLEHYLAKRMLPVEPRPELIARLQTRLVQPKPEVTVEAMPAKFPAWLELKYVLLGAAGVISSVLLIISGVKSIQSLRKLRAGRDGSNSMTQAA